MVTLGYQIMKLRMSKQRNISRVHVVDIHKIFVTVQICALNTQLLMALTIKPSALDTLSC